MSHSKPIALACLLVLSGLDLQAAGQTYRNIALNPNDVRAPGHGFPHASSNSEYPCNYDTAPNCVPDTTFLALSAINGDTLNTSHGSLAYASWGPQLTAPSPLWWKVDFGHDVSVDKVKIWVRADWSGGHDSYWKRATLVFTNGTRDTIAIDSLKTGQEFPFASRITQSVTITDLVASNPAKWCAFTEVQAWGYDPPTSAKPAPTRARNFPVAEAGVVCFVPDVSSPRLHVPDRVVRVELFSVLGRKVWGCECKAGANGSFVSIPSDLRGGIFYAKYFTHSN
jgi:hypothetical protein